jgi:membrane protein DedA with SNARE-associated domain
MLPYEHHLLSAYGYAGLFVLLALGIVGVPVPDETLIAAAGLLVRTGTLRAIPVFIVAVAGTACGITLSFVIGRTFGFRVLRRLSVKRPGSHARLARFHHWFSGAGRWTLIVGYFVPGVRHVVALGAGSSKLSWRSFATFAYTGAVLWVTTFLSTGYALGAEWERAGPRVRYLILAVAVGVTALAAFALWLRRRHTRMTTPEREPGAAQETEYANARAPSGDSRVANDAPHDTGQAT